MRVKALHRVRLCGAGFVVYERFRSEVKRLQKDPSPGCGPRRCMPSRTLA